MLNQLLIIAIITIISYKLYTQLTVNIENMTDSKNSQHKTITKKNTIPIGDSMAYRFDYNVRKGDKNLTNIENAYAADSTISGIPRNRPYERSNQKNPNLFNRRFFNTLLGEDEVLDNIRKGARVNVFGGYGQDNFGSGDPNLYNSMNTQMTSINKKLLSRNVIRDGRNKNEITITRGLNTIDPTSTLPSEPRGTQLHFKPRSYHESGSGIPIKIPVSGGRIPIGFKPMTNFERMTRRRKVDPVEITKFKTNNTLGLISRLKHFLTFEHIKHKKNLNIANIQNNTAIMSNVGKRRKSSLGEGEEYILIMENMKEDSALNNKHAVNTIHRRIPLARSRGSTNIRSRSSRKQKENMTAQIPLNIKKTSMIVSDVYNKPSVQVKTRITNPNLLNKIPKIRFLKKGNNVYNSQQILNTLKMSTDSTKRRKGVDIITRTSQNNKIYRRTHPPVQKRISHTPTKIIEREREIIIQPRNGLVNNLISLNTMDQTISKNKPKKLQLMTRVRARNSLTDNSIHNMLNNN